MTYRDFIKELADYYDEPLEKKLLTNPKIRAITEYVEYNWTEVELPSLLEYIKTEYTGRTIPLVWNFKEFKVGKFSSGVNMYARTNKCKLCGARAFQPLNGVIYCYECYQDQWGKDYVFKRPKNKDGISRFLIIKGKESQEWKDSTEQEKRNALEYYNNNPDCPIVKSKKHLPIEKNVIQVTLGLNKEVAKTFGA